jgi:CRP-like cAMP-binding protein
MEAIEGILAQHDFFRGLDPKYVTLLAGCGTNMRFDPGDYVFREGEAAQTFYLIRHGQVAIELYDPRRGQIPIDTMIENDVLGWSWLFAPYKWHFSARSVSMTRAIALDGKCLRDKIEADHDLGYDLMHRFASIIIDRLQATRLQVLNVYG